MKAGIGPLCKLACFCSRKKCFQTTNNKFWTSFRGGPILSLPLLLLVISFPFCWSNSLYSGTVLDGDLAIIHNKLGYHGARSKKCLRISCLISCLTGTNLFWLFIHEIPCTLSFLSIKTSLKVLRGSPKANAQYEVRLQACFCLD